MKKDEYRDADGDIFEERPCGRREYVGSQKLTRLKHERDVALEQADGFYDELVSFDDFDAVDQPYERHSVHEAYIDARIRLDGIDAAITRERWRLMRKGSEYGYVDIRGDRFPYDDEPVAPDMDPDGRRGSPSIVHDGEDGMPCMAGLGCDRCDAVKPIDITVGQLAGMCFTPDSVTMSLNQYGRNITEAVVAALVDVRDSMAAHERRILDNLSARGPSPQYAEVIDARRSQLTNCIGWIDLQIAEIREREEGWES